MGQRRLLFAAWCLLAACMAPPLANRPAEVRRPHVRCEPEDDAASNKRRGCYKRWTVLVYMAAEVEDELAAWSWRNLAEMERAPADQGKTASSRDVDVLVQLNTRSESQWIPRIHVLQVGGRSGDTQPEIGNEKVFRSPVVEYVRKTSSGQPARDLAAFLTWGIHFYPAEHYMIVIWGHGEGWGVDQRQPVAGPPGTPFPIWTGGIALDYTQRTYLGIPALRDSLQQAAREAGHLIDVVAADACLMQSVEVITELADVSRYVVGSTQIEYLGGLPYGEIIARMNSGDLAPEACVRAADREACAVALMIPEAYHRSFGSGLRSKAAAEKVALSAVKSAEIRRALLPALADLGRGLAGYLREDPSARFSIREALRDGAALGNFRDIGAFLTDLKLVLTAPGQRRDTPAARVLSAAIEKTRRALDETILGFRCGARYDQQKGFRSLSVWLSPDKEDYRRNKARYLVSRFFQYDKRDAAHRGSWESWLDRLWQ